jgi:hypothetical protein
MALCFGAANALSKSNKRPQTQSYDLHFFSSQFPEVPRHFLERLLASPILKPFQI